MNISGPLPIVPSQRPEEPAAALRVNQRMSAEVLQVAGDRVLLSVDGVKIVARMTTPDQAAQLTERRVANFLVKDMSGPVISLQLIGTQAAAGAAGSQMGDLVAQLLQNMGIPLDQANVYLARALLLQGLPVTKELVNQLRALLDQNAQQTQNAQAGQQAWGQTEAQMAAAFKAAGLPISPGTLSLALTEMLPLAEGLSRLRTQLAETARSNLSPQLSALITQAQKVLDELGVDWNATPEKMAESLRQTVTLLGRSLESDLALLARQGGQSLEQLDAGNRLLVLVRLRQELARDGPQALLQEIDRFLDSVRLMQFTNSEPVAEPVKEQWLNLVVPLRTPPSAEHSQAELQSTQLRLAYRVEEGERQIDPSYSRLVIQVELDKDDIVQVDLSIVGRQIGALVTTSTPVLLEKAKDGLPEFKHGLESAGYHLQTSQCEVGLLTTDPKVEYQAAASSLKQINVGV